MNNISTSKLTEAELQKHPFVAYADAFKVICRPLLKKGPISYISIIHTDGSYYNGLSTDAIFAEGYLKRELYLYEFDIYNTVPFPQHHVVWNVDNLLKVGQKHEEYRQFFKENGYTKGITICTLNDGGLTRYHFSIKDKNVLPSANMGFLFKNVGYFKKSVFFLQERLHKNPALYKAYEKKYFVVQKEKTKRKKNKNCIHIIYGQKSANSFLISKYYLGGKFRDIYFTPREMEILTLLAKGNTGRKISELLQISIRTVETYLLMLKKKVGVKNIAFLKNSLFENSLFRESFI
ncbi:MAG: helix-turn-helix transcriptional regulator [Gammaproteobacteria bacterium]|nr:helix-turn-helix transcriptional regulator [Gammaproteobacteria bacterium]